MKRPGAPGRVDVAWTVRRRGITDAQVRRVVRAALAFGERPQADLSVVFVDDATLARMHGTWLGDPSPTDVISFDLEGGGGGAEGELYVSVERASAVAKRRRVRLERELSLYLVHGCLHLCGYDDKRPRARSRMRSAEATVLAQLGFEPDEVDGTDFGS